MGTEFVAQLMKYHLLLWEVVKVKFLMNSNMILTGPSYMTAIYILSSMVSYLTAKEEDF